jgi:hypothetical protein
MLYGINVRNKSMRTTRLLIMVTPIIVAGLLVLATSNAAFAQTTSASVTSSISQSNTQTSTVQQCSVIGISNTGQCNQVHVNSNNNDVVGSATQSTSLGDQLATKIINEVSSILENTASSISQSNTQTSLGDAITNAVSSILASTASSIRQSNSATTSSFSSSSP